MREVCRSVFVNLVAGATALVLSSGMFAQEGSGSISGVVAGDDGKPLAAVVTAKSTGSPAASRRGELAPDGSFHHPRPSGGST